MFTFLHCVILCCSKGPDDWSRLLHSLMTCLRESCFRNLRELFKLNAAEYMMSICGDDGLRELSSPGKSGSIFYHSRDDRFVIKTLKRSELKVWS